jgi:copper chaperone
VNQLVLSVPTISCGHCVNTITAAVSDVPGVSAVEVDLATKSVTVTGPADGDAVRAAIMESGYQPA